MSILAIIGRIHADIDANMQGIKIAIPSSHVRTRDTHVASSWPTAHSNIIINHLGSYKTYLIISKPNRNTSWGVKFASIRWRQGRWQVHEMLVTISNLPPEKGVIFGEIILSYKYFGSLAVFRQKRNHCLARTSIAKLVTIRCSMSAKGIDLSKSLAIDLS